MALVEVEGVKLTPIKWLKEFVAMPARIGKLDGDVHRLEADIARSQIIRFACDIRRGEAFDEESYGLTLMEIDKYINYCRQHEEYENRKCVAAIELIEEEYKRRRKERSFLK